MEINKNKVLSVISYIPLSATAIAKKLGLSKGSQIQNYIDELIDGEFIKADYSGRFVTYVRSEKKQVVETKTPSPVKDGGECKVIPTTGRMTNVNPTGESYVDLNGYSIVKPATNKSGQLGCRVTLPSADGEKKKTVFVKQGMTLVIINETPRYIVDTPARLIIACHTYAKENNITSYSITEANVGVINGEDDIKMSDVVKMTIKPIDKGA